jgi:hypothetical protein
MGAPTPRATLDGIQSDRVSEFASASDLVRRLRSSQPSTAEILQELRQRFPHTPLSMRVAALDALRSG